jgi:putative Holliday junction resolvase
MVVLAVDVGTVRVGCASAESSVRISFPVAVWPRAKNEAEVALLQEIVARKAELLVVGMPFGPNGEHTTMCDHVENFVRRISKRSPIQIAIVDESFSSDEASKKVSSSSSGREIDAYAACLILDRYFEENPA